MEDKKTDEKEKNAQKTKDVTEGEKNEIVNMVNKMTSTFNYIQKNMHNTQWMDTKSGRYEGLAGGLTFMYTLSLINLTRWLKRLTIVLIAFTIINIILILGPEFGWF